MGVGFGQGTVFLFKLNALNAEVPSGSTKVAVPCGSGGAAAIVLRQAANC
jgi:hypothetical protein